MNMSDLRVRVDRKHFELYNDLTQAGVISEAHVLFFAAACIGYRQNRRTSLEHRQDKFWSRTFSVDEWACLYSIALSHWHGQFDRVQDDKAVIELMEEFATGGVNYLVESVFAEYLLRDKNEPRLDQSSALDLPKLLVYELWQLSDEDAQPESLDFELSMKRRIAS